MKQMLSSYINGIYQMENLQKQKMRLNQTFLKQNNPNGLKKSSCKFGIKSRMSQVSQTQSLFSSKKNSLKNISNANNAGINDFCQTLSTGFGNQWLRPESKHASRRQSNRPQTSKGPRSYFPSTFGQMRSKCLNEFDSKSPFPSKSLYNCPIQKQGQLSQQEQKQDFDENCFKNIRIVVTRNERPRKEKSIYNEKFQTNLPQDFLSLFAD